MRRKATGWILQATNCGDYIQDNQGMDKKGNLQKKLNLI